MSNLPNRESTRKGFSCFAEEKDMWVKQILADRMLSPTAKNIGVAISIHMNSIHKEAWPSHSRLARMCGVAKRTSERATRELERAGHLRVTHRSNTLASGNEPRSNLYEMVHFATSEAKDPDRSVEGGTDASVSLTSESNL